MLQIKNIINGEEIQDADVLENTLGLEAVGNQLINYSKDFGDEGKNAFVRPGIGLGLIMMTVKVGQISDPATLSDFMTRLYFLQSVGRNPLNMPSPEDWATLFNTLSVWIDKGWEHQINQDPVARSTWVQSISSAVYDEADAFVKELITDKLTKENPEKNE
jgi:hypothetical protein